MPIQNANVWILGPEIIRLKKLPKTTRELYLENNRANTHHRVSKLSFKRLSKTHNLNATYEGH